MEDKTLWLVIFVPSCSVYMHGYSLETGHRIYKQRLSRNREYRIIEQDSIYTMTTTVRIRDDKRYIYKKLFEVSNCVRV